MAVVICDKANRQIKRKRRITVANEACYALLFFDKKYILISRRYQFDPACPSGNTDAHNQKKKKKYKKEKSRLSD
jgi:hypothetical protein